MRLTAVLLRVVLVSGLVVPAASASVMVTAFYRLGDDDPSAVSGAVGKDPTRDSSGNGLDLTRYTLKAPQLSTTPQYRGDIIAPTKYANGLSTYFLGGTTGTFDRYNRTGSIPMGSYWGMEAWLYVPQTPSPARTMCALFNGNYYDDGVGIRFLSSGALSARVSGHEVGSFAYADGQWIYAAVVQEGTTVRFYAKQGTGSLQTVGSLGSMPPVAPSGTSGFGIGSRWDANGSAFTGYVDEVRLFTFNPGEFSTADLLLNATSVPEPAGASALVLLALALAGRRGRRA